MHGLFDQVMHTTAGAAGSVVNWRVLLLSHHSPIPSLYKFIAVAVACPRQLSLSSVAVEPGQAGSGTPMCKPV